MCERSPAIWWDELDPKEGLHDEVSYPLLNSMNEIEVNQKWCF
jgi:hypothetical protein